MKKYIDEKYGVNSVLFANGIDKPVMHSPEIINNKYTYITADEFHQLKYGGVMQ